MAKRVRGGMRTGERASERERKEGGQARGKGKREREGNEEERGRDQLHDEELLEQLLKDYS